MENATTSWRRSPENAQDSLDCLRLSCFCMMASDDHHSRALMTVANAIDDPPWIDIQSFRCIVNVPIEKNGAPFVRGTYALHMPLTLSLRAVQRASQQPSRFSGIPCRDIPI